MSVKIRIFYQYGRQTMKYHTDITFVEWFPFMFPNHQNISFTDEDDYTHAIIINTYMPLLKYGIPKENVYGIALEPPGPPPFLALSNPFIEYAKKHIHKYFIGDATGLPPPFIGKFVFIQYFRPPKSILEKKNIVSIMVSHKLLTDGHRYRHVLAQEILRRGLPVDIYGNGCKLYSGYDSRLKGEFENPPSMFESYQFHIAVENFQVPHYFSEKIVNPLLFSTTPIYLGCPNIEKYLGKCHVPLNGEVENDISIIADICRSPEKYRIPIDRNAIFQKVNLVVNLEREGFFMEKPSDSGDSIFSKSKIRSSIQSILYPTNTNTNTTNTNTTNTMSMIMKTNPFPKKTEISHTNISMAW